MKTLANAGDAAEIRGRIERLTSSDVPQWGSMNVAQMVCHLADTFGCPMGERCPARLKPPLLMSARLYKRVALNTPTKWPTGVPTPPEMDQLLGGTRPTEFTADIERLLREFDRMTMHDGPWSEHPMFGAMTTQEWLRWGWLHTDHHLRQFGR